MNERHILGRLLDEAMRGGYVAELPANVIADRLIAAGVRLAGPDAHLHEWVRTVREDGFVVSFVCAGCKRDPNVLLEALPISPDRIGRA